MTIQTASPRAAPPGSADTADQAAPLWPLIHALIAGRDMTGPSVFA
jgi:hypothetical protein